VLTTTKWGLFFTKCTPKNGWIEKLIVSESAPQELSNEWKFKGWQR
jgi:hypothetical protein